MNSINGITSGWHLHFAAMKLRAQEGSTGEEAKETQAEKSQEQQTAAVRQATETPGSSTQSLLNLLA